MKNPVIPVIPVNWDTMDFQAYTTKAGNERLEESSYSRQPSQKLEIIAITGKSWRNQLFQAFQLFHLFGTLWTSKQASPKLEIIRITGNARRNKLFQLFQLFGTL